MRRTKVTKMIQHGLEDKFSSNLFEILNKKNFSIKMDETTDRGTKNQSVFKIIFICPRKKEVRTRFFDLVGMG